MGVESDSSEDDFVAPKPAPKTRPTPNKASMKVDKPMSKHNGVHQDMSDDASNVNVPLKKTCCIGKACPENQGSTNKGIREGQKANVKAQECPQRHFSS